MGKVTRQRGEVEVLRFLSLKLVREVLLLYIFFTFNLAEEHDLTLFLDFVLLPYLMQVGGKLYLCPLPGCQFSTNREGMDAGRLVLLHCVVWFLLATNKHVHRAAIHLTESHNMQVEPSKRASPSYACPLPYCPFTTNRCHEQTKKHHEKRRTVPDINIITNKVEANKFQAGNGQWVCCHALCVRFFSPFLLCQFPVSR